MLESTLELCAHAKVQKSLLTLLFIAILVLRLPRNRTQKDSRGQVRDICPRHFGSTLVVSAPTAFLAIVD